MIHSKSTFLQDQNIVREFTSGGSSFYVWEMKKTVFSQQNRNTEDQSDKGTEHCLGTHTSIGGY